MEKWFNVGKIVNTHGIKGEVRVISTTDFPEERYKVGKRCIYSKKMIKSHCRLQLRSIVTIKTLIY